MMRLAAATISSALLFSRLVGLFGSGLVELRTSGTQPVGGRLGLKTGLCLLP